MQKICVAFAVGKDIIQKLQSLSAEERKAFVLGRIDNDYFRKHFYGIEELDGDWNEVLSYYSKKRGLAILEHGVNLEDLDKNHLLMLVEEGYIKEIVDVLHTWEPMAIAMDYDEFIKIYEKTRENFTFYRFVYYIDSLQALARHAMEVDGTILFSLEY